FDKGAEACQAKNMAEAGTTQDLDLWFGAVDAERLAEAARHAGGFYVSGIGLQGRRSEENGLDRVDVVLSASGLDSFEEEYSRCSRRRLPPDATASSSRFATDLLSYSRAPPPATDRR